VAVPEDLARQYRGRIIFGPFAPVHPQEIDALEGELGRPIPPAYRSFLELANGRHPVGAGQELPEQASPA
jgi:hypothetical protein